MNQSVAERAEKLGERAGPSWLQRVARRAVTSVITRIEHGQVVLEDAEGTLTAGTPTPEFPTPLRLRVLDPAFYAAVLRGAGLGAGESWIRGEWTCDDLPALLRVIARNRSAWDALDSWVERLARPLRRFGHWLERNTRAGARRNIAAHYDLGNDFFQLFLDPTLTYSCGVFEHPEATLEQASVAKYERWCRKLELQPGMHVLEIGSGWGGFALHAARAHGCRVTTTTISQAQHEVARERIARAGLDDRVTLLLEDYRDLRGSYDRLVSIEMIEAVGARYFDDYFRACAARLAPDGAMGLQAIALGDRDWARYRRGVDFIQKYVFPGGELPSLGAIAASLARATDLRVSHLEDLAPHYAETLRRWRDRLRQNAGAVLRLGHREPFLRLWEFYLAYCEAGFAERHLGLLQLVLSKPEFRRDSILGSL
jgi:cyclopropane-fatty-acyl-phospholipid synthase